MEEKHTFFWHAMPVTEVLSSFQTSKKGLASASIALKKDFKESEEQQLHFWVKLFFIQFAHPLVLILFVAGLIGVFLEEWVDVAVIFSVIFLNAILGFVEEYKAEKTLEALQKYLPVRVRVRRDNQVQFIDAEGIVEGDIVLLASGDRIIADGRLMKAESFEVSEAALTGESQAILKNVRAVSKKTDVFARTSMVYAGTVVVSGYAEMIVTAVGDETELGQIQTLLEETEEGKTPLQKRLSVFSSTLAGIIVFLAAVLFVIGVYQGLAPVEVFYTAVAVAVASIPEGLVIAVTMILAIGMNSMLKRKVLVRKLVAAETLGSVSVICTDKTGTLTTGKMEVVELQDGKKVCEKNDKAAKLLRQAIIGTNNASFEVNKETGEKYAQGSSTEISLLEYMQKFPEELEAYTKKKMVSDMPFSHTRKFSARSFVKNGNYEIFAFGAPERLLAYSDITDKQKQAFMQTVENMTSRGLRVLAAGMVKKAPAHKSLKEEYFHDMQIIGFIGLKDPLRVESEQLIRTAYEAKIQPVMITGDHPETAYAIAKEAGFKMQKKGLVTGEELDLWSDDKLESEVHKISVYARVQPAHKMRIIQAWQRQGASVAMTGDGVNDAPALKAADIGIALGSGTAVAKEASDMVILENNFATVIAAIEEGRTIFDNIRKTIVNMMADSFSEVVLVFGAILMVLPMPILPAQILFINLIADGLPSVALAFEKGEKNLMKEAPRKRETPILDQEMKVFIFGIGLLTDAVLFSLFFYFFETGMDLAEIRSVIFAALGLDSLLYVFAIRKFRSSIFTSNPFENRFLLGSVVLSLIFLILPFMFEGFGAILQVQAISVEDWLLVIGLAFGKLLLIEIVKEAYTIRRRYRTGIV